MPVYCRATSRLPLRFLYEREYESAALFLDLNAFLAIEPAGVVGTWDLEPLEPTGTHNGPAMDRCLHKYGDVWTV